MNGKILNTLVRICKKNEEYTMIYTPAHERISLVYTNDFNNEILYIEKTTEDKVYKFESESDIFTDMNIDFIISNIYNTLLSLKFESFIEDLEVNNVDDFNNIIDIINQTREKYC